MTRIKTQIGAGARVENCNYQGPIDCTKARNKRGTCCLPGRPKSATLPWRSTGNSEILNISYIDLCVYTSLKESFRLCLLFCQRKLRKFYMLSSHVRLDDELLFLRMQERACQDLGPAPSSSNSKVSYLCPLFLLL